MIHAVTLRIQINENGQDALGLSHITDALGECARALEHHEAEGNEPVLGLVPDTDDPGRFSWSITAESYPGMSERDSLIPLRDRMGKAILAAFQRSYEKHGIDYDPDTCYEAADEVIALLLGELTGDGIG